MMIGINVYLWNALGFECLITIISSIQSSIQPSSSSSSSSSYYHQSILILSIVALGVVFPFRESIDNKANDNNDADSHHTNNIRSVLFAMSMSSLYLTSSSTADTALPQAFHTMFIPCFPHTLACIVGMLIARETRWKRKLAVLTIGLEMATCCGLMDELFIAQIFLVRIIFKLVEYLQLSSCDCFSMSILVAASSVVLLHPSESFIFARRHIDRGFDCAASIDLVAIGIQTLLVIFYLEGKVVSVCASFKVSKVWRIGALWAIFVISVIGMFITMQIVLGGTHPLYWILHFLAMDKFRRLYICGYWVGLLCLAIPFAQKLTDWKYPNICVRKLFHLLAALMFSLPLLDSMLLSFVSLALGVAMCALLIVEGARAPVGQGMISILPVSIEPMMDYFQLFVDKRDEGRLIVLSHIYLLFACAFPVWCWSLALAVNPEAFDLVVSRIPLFHVIPHIGYITVGLGDGMAAVVGSQWGRCRWSHSKKTQEGTLAAALTMLIAFISILWWLRVELNLIQYAQLTFVSAIVAYAEAVTILNDNLVLPLYCIVSLIVITSDSWSKLALVI